jgi:hypothetical protein
MKAGRSLMELASEIERQAKSKRDFVANSAALTLSDDGKNLAVGDSDFGVTDICHGQIASQLGIPKPYYDRMRAESPALLANNVNTWLRHEPTRRMVRTLDSNARAWLSDRYRPLDNYDVLAAILPVVQNTGLQVQSCEVTERRMYLKAVDPQRVKVIRREGHYDGGRHDKVETFQPGVVVSNSEIGMGSLSVSPGTHKVECTNLSVFKNDGIAKYHIGGKANGEGGDISEYMSDEARRAEDLTFWLKVRDMVKACIAGPLFEKLVDQIEAAGRDKIESKIENVVEVTSARFGFVNGERDGVLEELVRGADFTRLGLSNAITRFSQAVEDYDRATELERVGGQVVEMPRTEWERLAAAVASD